MPNRSAPKIEILNRRTHFSIKLHHGSCCCCCCRTIRCARREGRGRERGEEREKRREEKRREEKRREPIRTSKVLQMAKIANWLFFFRLKIESIFVMQPVTVAVESVIFFSLSFVLVFFFFTLIRCSFFVLIRLSRLTWRQHQQQHQQQRSYRANDVKLLSKMIFFFNWNKVRKNDCEAN